GISPVFAELFSGTAERRVRPAPPPGPRGAAGSSAEDGPGAGRRGPSGAGPALFAGAVPGRLPFPGPSFLSGSLCRLFSCPPGPGGSASGHRREDAHLGAVRHRGVQSGERPALLVADEDVDEPAGRPRLVAA